MQILKERIVKDGKCIGDDILKVDSFLNHQIDVELLSLMGKEFSEIFKDLGINKILTIEASGIPIACEVARQMGNLPVVFAKKSAPSTMVEGCYVSPVVSFTKGTTSYVRVSKEFIGENDIVLLIDDFLARGEAANGLFDICRQAGAKCVGLGAAIEKQYQGGAERLRAKGLKVVSLACIKIIHDGHIEFVD